MRLLKNLKTGKSRHSLHSFSHEYAVARRKMLEEQLISRNIHNERVLEVMAKIPRHRFVEEALVSQAYSDSPLNIGWGQTISQPYTVALLAQALELQGNEKILEIGTGCGYQSAVLSQLADQIYSIERLSPLLLKARKHLKELGLQNIILKLGDGSLGWPEKGPFAAIVAAAVSPEVPEPLVQQLCEGGRLVMPIAHQGKQFLVYIKKEKGHLKKQMIEECRFVKMVGNFAY
ncbi:MAG: protein-L-isoaspartate(D-aspartate) O-methyltransferase [Deltaproteobacteria bacterium]|nr:protein-L-isoaspartate(D-aspartate) O-methyltransferase [Deltaproteobacteria bacterium]